MTKRQINKRLEGIIGQHQMSLAAFTRYMRTPDSETGRRELDRHLRREDRFKMQVKELHDDLCKEGRR